MEIPFHSHFESNRVIATKFCTWHDSCAVVACAKICRDLMASSGITARRSFHRIWIAGKKTLVKRAPGPISLRIFILIQILWTFCYSIPAEVFATIFYPWHFNTELYNVIYWIFKQVICYSNIWNIKEIYNKFSSKWNKDGIVVHERCPMSAFRFDGLLIKFMNISSVNLICW